MFFFKSRLTRVLTYDIQQLFHEFALDMIWWLANEERSAELAIIISYQQARVE